MRRPLWAALWGSVREILQSRDATPQGNWTSVGLTAAGFVGQYEKEAGKINITASYAAVVQRARQDEDGITAVPFVGNGQAEAGKDCFYLGGETSHGAVGLSLDQMTGKAVVRDRKTLDQIYQEDGGILPITEQVHPSARAQG